MQFHPNENRITFLLWLMGMVFGLSTGYFIKDGAESFHSIQIFNYQIPQLISFGMTVSLAIQLVSVLLSWMALNRGTEFYHTQIVWLLMGVPMGMIIILNVFGGYLVALGFVIPNILDIIFSPIVMIFVGWHTMHLLWANAVSLLPLYIISTGIIWFVESCRSLV